MRVKNKGNKKRLKRGASAGRRAVSKNKPLKQGKDDLFGFMAGRFEIVGDIESPISDWVYWRPEKSK